MFGYVIINKSEMKFREYDVYHSYYCGLCKELKKSYGAAGQATLSFDMTFVEMLLTSLYEVDTPLQKKRCFLHPFEKKEVRRNEISSYVADMNVLLAIYKCADDWEDDRKLHKRLFGGILQLKSKEQRRFYREKEGRIRDLLYQIRKGEQEECQDIDYMSGLFGEIMGEILVYRSDEWQDTLRRLGFYLGKFIYIMDAYEDVPKDIKSGNYNPLKTRYQSQAFEDDAHTILTMMMAECCKEFEQLPILENVDILRNILYSGVWCKYELVHQKRMQELSNTKQDQE